MLIDSNKKIQFIINNFVVRLKRELEKEFEAVYEKNKGNIAVWDQQDGTGHPEHEHHEHHHGHGGNIVIVDVETAEAAFISERKKEIIHEVTEAIVRIDLFDKSKQRFKRLALVPLRTKR